MTFASLDRRAEQLLRDLAPQVLGAVADALAYADAVLQPDVMIDVATLTGAVRVALGTQIGGLYASDDQVAGGLLAAARVSGDALWRMPLVGDYRDALDSPVADLANVSRRSGARAGSIDAALFLREFTGGRPWAHPDIAGAAPAAPGGGQNNNRATGFGTRGLLRRRAGGPSLAAATPASIMPTRPAASDNFTLFTNTFTAFS